MVYQETYDRPVYSKCTRPAPRKISTGDWPPERAYEAGFRRLGIGLWPGDWRWEACHLLLAQWLLRHAGARSPCLYHACNRAREFEPLVNETDTELVQLTAAFRFGRMWASCSPPVNRQGCVTACLAWHHPCQRRQPWVLLLARETISFTTPSVAGGRDHCRRERHRPVRHCRRTVARGSGRRHWRGLRASLEGLGCSVDGLSRFGNITAILIKRLAAGKTGPIAGVFFWGVLSAAPEPWAPATATCAYGKADGWR